TSFLDGTVGDYTLSINTPTITTVTPGFALPGSTVRVTVLGTRFLPGMTLAAAGVAATNVTVLSSTLATATLTVPSDAPPGPRDLTVTSPEGTSNPVTFVVPQPISVGQRIAAALSASNQVSTIRFSLLTGTYSYAALYQFSLSSPATVTVDMRS